MYSPLSLSRNACQTRVSDRSLIFFVDIHLNVRLWYSTIDEKQPTVANIVTQVLSQGLLSYLCSKSQNHLLFQKISISLLWRVVFTHPPHPQSLSVSTFFKTFYLLRHPLQFPKKPSWGRGCMEIFLNFALSSHIIVSWIHIIPCSEKVVRVCGMVFQSVSLKLVTKFYMFSNYNNYYWGAYWIRFLLVIGDQRGASC